MKFTFGIITSADLSGYTPNRLNTIFESIALDESYDDVEVVVVGGKKSYTWEHYTFIAFDESKKTNWITRKKNIITENAKYDNIVYMHDYVSLMPGWYKGFEQFGDNFDVCVTKMQNADGSRFRDWTIHPDDITHIIGPWNGKYLLPYDVSDLSKYMYISGAYWIAKKDIMEKYPLDENLSWGEGEDVKWSMEVRKNHKFSLNPYSTVRLLKQKETIFSNADVATIEKLRKHIDINVECG